MSSLNILLTSTCWRNDHNGFSHQGPGLIDSLLSLAPGVVRVWLPPDANSGLSIMDHCLRSKDHVNLIVLDKQPHLQYLSMDEADELCAQGAGIWEWASNVGPGEDPDLVIAAAGDVPTQEALAATELLRQSTRSSTSASSTSSTSWRCCPRRTTRTATSTRSSTTCSPLTGR